MDGNCLLMGIKVEEGDEEPIALDEFIIAAGMAAELALDAAATRGITPEVAHMFTRGYIAAVDLLAEYAALLDSAIDRMTAPAETPDHSQGG